MHVVRQARRKAVDVVLRRASRLRLDEKMMPVAIAESIYLILDARAVARTYALYLSRKKRRFVEIRADNLVRGLVRVGDVAG